MAPRLATLTLIALVPLAAGCGDDERVTTPRPPALTIPGGESGGDSTSTSETTPPMPDTVAAPETSERPAPAETAPKEPRDSPQNDMRPPSGSPAERFEEFCRKKPDACG